jgi:hypothetical protein
MNHFRDDIQIDEFIKFQNSELTKWVKKREMAERMISHLLEIIERARSQKTYALPGPPEVK